MLANHRPQFEGNQFNGRATQGSRCRADALDIPIPARGIETPASQRLFDAGVPDQVFLQPLRIAIVDF
jgi:hypothetical protein